MMLPESPSRRRAGRLAMAREIRAAAVRAVAVAGLLSWPAFGCSLATNLDSLSSAGDWPDAAVLDAARDSHGGGVRLPPLGNRPDGALFPAGTDGGAMVDGSESADALARDLADDREREASDGPGPDGEAVADAALSGDVTTSTDVLGATDMGRADATTDAGSGDGGGDALQLMCSPSPTRTATLQLLNGGGATTACGFARADLPPFLASVDSATFAASAACGGCLRIETPAAVVEAMLVDLGPGKTAANATTVAVNRAALNLLAPDGSTYVDQGVEWRFVACSLASGSGMTFLFQPGSNASYAALLIQNHRFRIDTVEYRIGSVYHRLTRTNYNYWVAQSGMGGGPFILRMTDVLGNVVEQTGVPLMPGVLFRGQAQFPSCREASN